MEGVRLLPADQVNISSKFLMSFIHLNLNARIETCISSNVSTLCAFLKRIMTLCFIPASSNNAMRNRNKIDQLFLDIM